MPIMTPRNIPPLVLLYAQNGMGKTTLACMASKPLIICADGRSDLILGRAPILGEPNTFSELLSLVQEALEIANEQQALPYSKREYHTLIIDDLSSVARLGEEELLAKYSDAKNYTMGSICGGFFKAYDHSMDKHHAPIAKLIREIRRAGMMVVLTCQAGTASVDNPTFDQAINQWQPSLYFSKTGSIGGMWCDLATVIGFLTMESSFKSASSKTGQLSRANAGERVVLFDGNFRFRAKHAWPNHEPELPADETFWSRLFSKQAKPEAAPASE